MKNLLLIIIAVNLFSACNDSRNNSSIQEVGLLSSSYYFDINNNLYTSIQERNNMLIIHKIDKTKGVINKCLITTNNEMSCALNIEDLLLKRLMNYKQILLQHRFNSLQDTSGHLYSYNTQYQQVIDSAKFWIEVSKVLDNTIFNFPKDKLVLDYTYAESNVYQSLVVSVNDLNKAIVIDKLGFPKLFFDVTTDQQGYIKDVDYNSWGKEVYKDLIIDLTKILKTKSMRMYKILDYPVNMKLTIGVIID